MNVVWMRHRRSAIGHAFAEPDVTTRLDPLVPIMNCDRYPFQDVLRDDLADRCEGCAHAVRKLARQ